MAINKTDVINRILDSNSIEDFLRGIGVQDANNSGSRKDEARGILEKAVDTNNDGFADKEADAYIDNAHGNAALKQLFSSIPALTQAQVYAALRVILDLPTNPRRPQKIGPRAPKDAAGFTTAAGKIPQVFGRLSTADLEAVAKLYESLVTTCGQYCSRTKIPTAYDDKFKELAAKIAAKPLATLAVVTPPTGGTTGTTGTTGSTGAGTTPADAPKPGTVEWLVEQFIVSVKGGAASAGDTQRFGLGISNRVASVVGKGSAKTFMETLRKTPDDATAKTGLIGLLKKDNEDAVVTVENDASLTRALAVSDVNLAIIAFKNNVLKPKGIEGGAEEALVKLFREVKTDASKLLTLQKAIEAATPQKPDPWLFVSLRGAGSKDDARPEDEKSAGHGEVGIMLKPKFEVGDAEITLVGILGGGVDNSQDTKTGGLYRSEVEGVVRDDVGLLVAGLGASVFYRATEKDIDDEGGDIKRPTLMSGSGVEVGLLSRNWKLGMVDDQTNGRFAVGATGGSVAPLLRGNATFNAGPVRIVPRAAIGLANFNPVLGVANFSDKPADEGKGFFGWDGWVGEADLLVAYGTNETRDELSGGKKSKKYRVFEIAAGVGAQIVFGEDKPTPTEATGWRVVTGMKIRPWERFTIGAEAYVRVGSAKIYDANKQSNNSDFLNWGVGGSVSVRVEDTANTTLRASFYHISEGKEWLERCVPGGGDDCDGDKTVSESTTLWVGALGVKFPGLLGGGDLMFDLLVRNSNFDSANESIGDSMNYTGALSAEWGF